MEDFDARREERQRERKERFEGRDRTFKIGGEVFEYRLTLPFAVVDAIFGVGDDTAAGVVTERMDYALRHMIEPGESDEAFARLDAIKADVEVIDVQEAVFWILGELSDRPTLVPTSSGNGHEPTGERSTEPSSSEAAESAVSAA